MSTIYLILGIIGWVAVAITIPLYIAFGFRATPTAVRSDSVGAQPSSDLSGDLTAQRSA